MKEKQNDRISYSFGMKLSLPAKYESADFHISLSSDAREGETLEQTFNRVKDEVLKYAVTSYNQIRESESGLEETNAKQDSPSQPESRKAIPESKQEQPVSKNIPALKQQIKFALGVLESKKQLTKDEFVKTYLKNKKLAEMTEVDVTRTIVELREKFPELNL